MPQHMAYRTWARAERYWNIINSPIHRSAQLSLLVVKEPLHSRIREVQLE